MSDTDYRGLTVYRTMCGGESYAICGDFAQAASPIQIEDDDGNWHSTQWQVADFCHDSDAAMRAVLEESAGYSSNDPAVAAEIDAAIAAIECDPE